MTASHSSTQILLLKVDHLARFRWTRNLEGMNRKFKKQKQKPLLSITVNRKDERDFETAERFCDWLSAKKLLLH